MGHPVRIRWDQLSGQGGFFNRYIHKLRRTSVQVMLTRLEKYGWVAHRKEGRSFYYRALQDRSKTLKDIFDDFKKRIFGDSDREFLKFLFEGVKISSTALDRIATLLESKSE